MLRSHLTWRSNIHIKLFFSSLVFQHLFWKRLKVEISCPRSVLLKWKYIMARQQNSQQNKYMEKDNQLTANHSQLLLWIKIVLNIKFSPVISTEHVSIVVQCVNQFKNKWKTQLIAMNMLFCCVWDSKGLNFGSC